MIVMEFMEGGSFMDLIQNPQITNSVFWRKIVYKVILQTASGLKYMHSLGYVHLDVKPQNIFFPQKMGNTGESVYKSLKVKLGDLGVGLSLRFHEFVFNLSSSFPLSGSPCRLRERQLNHSLQGHREPHRTHPPPHIAHRVHSRALFYILVCNYKIYKLS